jgi:NADP-dependent aldehyde dehydrogenase
MGDGRILITGAAGNMGRLLRPRLGGELRLLDREPIPDAADAIVASVTDLDAMRAAVRGVSGILHLGGISVEDSWEKILDVNVNGTRTVLEAARLEGVEQVVLASSNHAVGFHGREEGMLPADVAQRPDTYYGVSKVAVEALGSLYHDRYGINVVCLRIGSCFERPTNARMLWTWMSPDDGARLVRAALGAKGFHIVWGISANTRRWWSLEAGEAIGYHPQDDAEAFAAEIAGTSDDESLAGGAFTRVPLGEPMS